MKSKIIASGLVALVAFGCQKKIAKEEIAPPPETSGQQLHPLGLIVTPEEEYQRLIDHDALLMNKANKLLACTSVDLTANFPAPGDQGQQGSCTAWSVGYTKSYWEGREMNWALNDPAHFASPHYIYSQIHANNDPGGGGSSPVNALNLIKDQGVATLDVCPYSTAQNGWQTAVTQTQRSQAIRFKNLGWTALPNGDYNEMKARLCNNEPVMLEIPVYPDFDNLYLFNDTYDDASGTLRGQHMITLIGYDDALQSFKFINQWGTFWGIGGYGNISYALINSLSLHSYVMYDRQNAVFAGDVNYSTSTFNVSTYGYLSGDVNGDGYTDVMQPWNNGGTLALGVHDISGSTPTVICNNTMTGSGINNVGFVGADFNGDGKTDLVQGWKNGSWLAFSVFKSNGTSVTPFGTWTMTGSGTTHIKLMPIDYDGDGKTDIAQLWSTGANKMAVSVFRSTGSSYTPAFTNTFNQGSGNIGIIPADYDGDGKTDIVQFWNNGGSLAAIIYRSTGASYYDAWSGTLPEGSNTLGLVPVDYDGDGKVEWVSGWNDGGKFVALAAHSTGASYTSGNNSWSLWGTSTLGLIPYKQAGNPKTGFVELINNFGKLGFIKYNVINY